MQAGLFASDAESMRDSTVPRDDEKQRQRIVARHIAACAEHQRYLAELEKGEKSCNG